MSPIHRIVTLSRFRISLYWEFARPCVMVMDIELLKKVQVTDFDYFVDTGLFSDEYLAKMGLQLGLSDSRGEQWKTLRRLLSPAFSMPRIKKTLQSQNRISRSFVKHLRKQEEETPPGRTSLLRKGRKRQREPKTEHGERTRRA